LLSMYENRWNPYNNLSHYYFVAFNDTLGKAEVQIDGRTVTRTAHCAAIDVEMAFDPIGPTGEVFFHNGLIPYEMMVDQGDQKPIPLEKEEKETYDPDITYVSLSQPAALRFVLPDYATYTIEKMSLTAQSYDGALPGMALYNHRTQAWDEQLAPSVSMTGEKWAPYIDAQGTLYVRYIPNEAGERYDGMTRPGIALKGKVKSHAKD
ncbi:MAG: hypothetical protein RR482_09160, partial [Clostridia bacterium]